jgi:hypothetical protein
MISRPRAKAGARWRSVIEEMLSLLKLSNRNGGEGYYEIKVQDSHTRHLLHVRPKGKILKDELD